MTLYSRNILFLYIFYVTVVSLLDSLKCFECETKQSILILIKHLVTLSKPLVCFNINGSFYRVVQQIVVGFATALFVFPPMILVTVLFRRGSISNKRTNRIDLGAEKGMFTLAQMILINYNIQCPFQLLRKIDSCHQRMVGNREITLKRK